MPSLPHDFDDESLLEQALTHASTGRARNNERLEFLGDAVLDLIVAESLYRSPSGLSEGEMTERKAAVVSRKSLAEAARRLQLERLARLGPGLSAARLPSSVLANLYEAVMGAVYLDAGLEAAREFTQHSLGTSIARLRVEEGERNPKQELQRRSQLETGDPPSYVLLEERGHAHAKAFCVAAEVGDERFPSAWGRTRKEAERWAAHEALLALGTDD